MRLCAISIDLDEVRLYSAIHGLADDGGASAHAVYERALPRYRDFAADRGLPLTFFAVGADLARDESARSLRQMVDAGHEIGNHTLDHYYDFSRRSAVDIAEQIGRCSDLIAERVGQRPVGFRAPGYVMSDLVYAQLSRFGIRYSSSVFPCPHYYLAKLSVLLAQRAAGRTSSSIVDSPRALGAPTGPYRTGTPYYETGGGLLELPIQVTPGLRLPFIGTALTLLGPRGARLLTRQLLGQPFINLELHGIDLLDRHDGLGALARHQPDLAVPVSRKWQVLSGVVDELRAAGYRFVRLDTAASELGARLPLG